MCEGFSHLLGFNAHSFYIIIHLVFLHTLNHTIEHLLVEVNTRANYPVKAVLVKMVKREEIFMDSATTRFCVSWFTVQVANEAITMFITSWNLHPVPGML